MPLRLPCSTLFPYTTLFRSLLVHGVGLVLKLHVLADLPLFVELHGLKTGLLFVHLPEWYHSAKGGSNRILGAPLDRKSTRLNSSHPSISYAVFFLKKKREK